MFEFFSQIVDHVAPFVVAAHVLFILAMAFIGGSVVVALAYYLVHCAGLTTSSLMRFTGSMILYPVRIAGSVISWQPKDYVGSPRSRRLADSNAAPGIASNEGDPQSSGG